MAKRLPRNCIVTISYCKGIPKRTIIEDGWFDVENSSDNFLHFNVEKEGTKFRLRDKTVKTTFGSWKHVAKDAQEILGDDPETISQVLRAVGIGKYDQIHNECGVVDIYEHDSVPADMNDEDGDIGEFGLAAMPKDVLDKTIAVYRAVVVDWNENDFLFDDDQYNDRLECMTFIFPEEAIVSSTQEDIDLYKEFAEQENPIAQCLLGMEYSEGLLSEEKDSQKSAQYWLDKAIKNGYEEARSLLDNIPLPKRLDYSGMNKRLPKNCNITISYCKGISKRKILEDGKFNVENSSDKIHHLCIEKDGTEFRLLDETSEMTYGPWEHVVEDAQSSLGDDPETISQVLTVAGIGKYDQVYDDFDVVNIYEKDSISTNMNEEKGGIGEFGLAALPKDRLDKTVAVYCVVVDWNDNAIPNDDHKYNDQLKCLTFIFPKKGNVSSTQEDIDLYKEFAEQENPIAQYLLWIEYREGLLSKERGCLPLAEKWLYRATRNGYTNTRSYLDDVPLPERLDNYKSYYEDGLSLQQAADSEVTDCLIEIKLVDNLDKETIFQNKIFKLDDQSVKLHIYKHDGKIGLIQNNAVQYFENEAEFVSACLHVTGSHLKVMTVVKGLAFCGLLDYWKLNKLCLSGWNPDILSPWDTPFRGTVGIFVRALGTQELDISEQYAYMSLSELSSFALSKGFAISRRIAPQWKPGQLNPEFDKVHDGIAVVFPESVNHTVQEDWELIQKLVKEGNPNAMLEAAKLYLRKCDSKICRKKSETLAKRALDLGCNAAKEFLEIVERY